MEKIEYFATNDAVFKMLFEDEDGLDLLKSLLAATLKTEKKDIGNLKINNSELSPDKATGKFCRLDISAEMNNTLLDIEMQVGNEEYFAERFLFYWCKLYTGTLKRGNKYEKLKKCISIAFLGYKLYGHRDFLSEFTVFDAKHKKAFTDKLKMYVYELPKLPKQLLESDSEVLWLKLLNATTEKELDMLTQTQNQDIMRAAKKLKNINNTPSKRKLAEARRMQRIEEASALSYAEKRGEKQGRNDMIEAMKLAGYTTEQINQVLQFAEKKIV